VLIALVQKVVCNTDLLACRVVGKATGSVIPRNRVHACTPRTLPKKRRTRELKISRPIGDFLIIEDSHQSYLADKGFTGVEWERRWLDLYGALVAATPKDNSPRGRGRKQTVAGLRESGRSSKES
jgi:hypothetical protein